MLICPECQHENSEDNQFCEKCETSLTHKTCNQCGAKVDLGTINCPSCKALTVDTYVTIITQPLQQSFVLPEFKQDLGSKLKPKWTYLDSGFRYGLLNKNQENVNSLEPVFQSKDKNFYALEVIDFKPLQKSSLDTILEVVKTLNHRSLINAGVPKIAFPYLTLAEFYPLVPELYDAWRNEETGQEFVIISKPQNWQLLSEVLQTKNFTLAEILAIFDDMAKLWQGLSKVNCCETILQKNNIGLDNHNNFTVKQIFPDNPENSPQLEQLLELWLDLLPKSLSKEIETIEQLLASLNSGEIENIKQLRSQMQSLSVEKAKDKEISLTIEDELESILDKVDFDVYDDDDSENATYVSANLEESTFLLPTEMLSLTDAGHTDIGKRRSHNEDCFAIDTTIHKKQTPQGIRFKGRGLYLVCDGMGGHDAGEVASAMALEKISAYWQENWQQELPEIDDLKKSILFANQAIYNVNIQKGTSGSHRMGTTLVMALIQDLKIALAHVGDSRIYRVTRKRGLEQLTIDHSVAQMDIRNGVDPKIAFSRVDAFQLTQALGPRDNNFVHPDISVMEIKENTLFVLCSDGLSDNNFLENHWQTCLSPLISSQTNLNEGLSKIIALANEVNGHDNITCVLVRVRIQHRSKHDQEQE